MTRLLSSTFAPNATLSTSRLKSTLVLNVDMVRTTHPRLRKLIKFGRRVVFSLCFIVFCLHVRGSGFIIPEVTVGKFHARALHFGSHQRVLHVNCVSGLGNRMRAFAQGSALAKKKNMKFIVIWVPDAHLNASMDDLFDTASLNVLNFDPKHTLLRENTLFFDDEKDERANKILDKNSSMDLYVRTPFRFDSETRISQLEFNLELQALKPCADVAKLVERYLSHLTVSIQNTVAVHIRHESNFAVDVPRTKSPIHIGGGDVIAKYRSMCNHTSFFKAMSKHLEQNRQSHFLIASDSPDEVQILARQFDAKRIHQLDHSLSVYCRTEETRQRDCVRFAYVELLALSKCGGGLIFSHWSSFSEILLAYHKGETMSGCEEV